jgi:predicted small secreted protein
MRALLASLVVAFALGLSGCGYNTIQTQDEQVKASWLACPPFAGESGFSSVFVIEHWVVRLPAANSGRDVVDIPRQFISMT